MNSRIIQFPYYSCITRRALYLLVSALPVLSSACKDLPKPNPFDSYEEVNIMPDDKGHIDGSSNEAGIQGQWYSYAGLDSVIRPTPLTPFSLTDGEICTNGTAAKVPGEKFTIYYGAGIGFYLCYSDGADTPPEFPYTLSECPLSPLSPNMHTKVAGIAFDIEASDKDAEFPEVRVIFREWHREESPYVSITAPGSDLRALFHEAKFLYPAKDNRPSHFAEIHSILFQVAGAEVGDQHFDFCISNLHLLINPESMTDTSPYEGTDTNTMDAGENCTPDHYLDAGLQWVRVGDTDDTDAFKILKTEVTAGQYMRCKEADCCGKTDDWEICSVDNMKGVSLQNEPANCVNWYQARAFCNWAGGHLPSEKEWIAAARDGNEDADYPYPWGKAEPSCEQTVMNDDRCNPPITRPAEVCSKIDGNTETGICDMAGNVWEWLEDWYPATKNVPEKTFRMMKGGSYLSKDEALKIDSQGMEHPSFPRDIGKIGFRCARD